MLTLEQLADRAAITDQIYNYARAVDRLDAELGYAVWHADGTADYGADNFIGSGHDFIDHVIPQHAAMLSHAHHMSNIQIRLDGDRAGSETYVLAVLHSEQGGECSRILVNARYIDRWSRREGRWALDHRIAVMDCADVQSVHPLTLRKCGARDRTDESYAVLSNPI